MDRVRRFWDWHEANGLLLDCLSDYFSMRTLRKVLCEHDTGRSLWRMDDHEVIEAVAWMLADQRLYLVEHKPFDYSDGAFLLPDDLIGDSGEDKIEEEQVVLKKKKLFVRLPIDPNSGEADGCRFILKSADGGEMYRQEKTVADDKIAGNKSVDLEYTDLIADVWYTLEVEHADGVRYIVFQDVSYGDMFYDD